jgi:predicted ATPase
MTVHCSCTAEHRPQSIVITGGPGAGKTALLEFLRQSLCDHVHILPESAGIVFGGGFPRDGGIGVKRAGQRAIFHVQLELEAAARADGARILLCDRGIVDGSAYWPEPGTLWEEVGVTREQALARYDAVIHLRVPAAGAGYTNGNPLRVESAADALRIDERIGEAWQGHPHLHVVEATADFPDKVRRSLEFLRADLPECCRAPAAGVSRGSGPASVARPRS